MGYVTTQSAILRVKPILDEMVQAEKDCSWPSDDPRLAYRIREAIAASKRLGIKEYAELSGKYIIRSAHGRTIAELRNKLALELLMDSTARMTLREVISLSAVVGAAIKHKAREMFFPDAVLEQEDIDKLTKWATSVGYELLNHEEEGVTLRRGTSGPDSKMG